MFDLGAVEGENTGWKPIKAGEEVPAILESVEYGKDQNETATLDLVFNFKGTAAGNTGTLNFRVWANNFDPQDQYYDSVKAERVLAQVKHILAAFLPEAVVSTVKGSNWKELSAKAISVMTDEVLKRPCALKVTLDNKNRPTLPLFPDFIITDLTPDRSLVLNTKINPKTGFPYERITPIELEQSTTDNSFGASQEAPAPSFGDAPAFGG